MNIVLDRFLAMNHRLTDGYRHFCRFIQTGLRCRPGRIKLLMDIIHPGHPTRWWSWHTPARFYLPRHHCCMWCAPQVDDVQPGFLMHPSTTAHTVRFYTFHQPCHGQECSPFLGGDDVSSVPTYTLGGFEKDGASISGTPPPLPGMDLRASRADSIQGRIAHAITSESGTSVPLKMDNARSLVWG